jgi:hypothetical protein
VTVQKGERELRARSWRRRAGAAVAPLVVAATMTAAPGAAADRFTDVAGNLHEGAIETIADLGITEGCDADGSRYCPAGVVTRGQMASFLLRAMLALGLEVPDPAPATFTDVAGSTHEAAIDRLAAAGVVYGFADGRFGPDRTMTRGQMALILHRGFWFPSVLGTAFGDVGPVHAEAVSALAHAGVTGGCDPGASRYCPGDPVRRDQMASFLVRSLDASSPGRAYGLSVSAEGVLVLDGQPFRGIGVNYFDAFYRHVKDPDDTTFAEGFRALADAGIPFARLMAGGFWPVEQRLYLDDRVEFFRRFDRVVRAAEMHGVGLIPSLFWHPATAPDLVGEPVSAWGDPTSRTHAYMRTYVRDVVTRYSRSPAVWGWEFGNEYTLGADLPNASEHRPPVHPDLGTAPTRSELDDLTHEMVRAAFTAFAQEVRRHDPHRVVSTGDSIPRDSAWHNWKEGTWTLDTPEQFAEMLLGNNPDPVDLVSIHAYMDDTPRIADAAAVAAGMPKPLFIGEFGAYGTGPETEAWFSESLRAVEASGAPLAALWVFDFAGQPEWSVTPTNERAWQLEAIARANQRMR